MHLGFSVLAGIAKRRWRSSFAIPAKRTWDKVRPVRSTPLFALHLTAHAAGVLGAAMRLFSLVTNMVDLRGASGVTIVRYCRKGATRLLKCGALLGQKQVCRDAPELAV